MSRVVKGKNGTYVLTEEGIKYAKGKPIRKRHPKARRNAPCPCGSKQKFKNCCGKPVPPRPQPGPTPYKTLRDQYSPSQKESEQAFVTNWGFIPDPSTLMLWMQGEREKVMEIVTKGIEKVGNKSEKDYSSFLAAVRKCGYLVTPMNQELLADEQLQAWSNELQETENVDSRPGEQDGNLDGTTSEAVPGETAGGSGPPAESSTPG